MPPALSIQEQQEIIISEAWRCLHEAATEGRMTLQNGTVISTADDAWQPQLQFFRQMAALKPPKQRETLLPEDFRPQTTRSQKDQAYGS